MTNQDDPFSRLQEAGVDLTTTDGQEAMIVAMGAGHEHLVRIASAHERLGALHVQDHMMKFFDPTYPLKYECDEVHDTLDKWTEWLKRGSLAIWC